jgi:hypothetical protein
MIYGIAKICKKCKKLISNASRHLSRCGLKKVKSKKVKNENNN